MQIETRVKKKVRRQIQETVLVSLYFAAGVSLAVMAPNAMRLLKYVERFVGPEPRLRRRMSQAISRLCDRGLIARVPTKKGTMLRLTPEGRAFATSLENSSLFVKKRTRKWDGKWRLITFDIWERRRTVRNRLRELLRRNGFCKIQNSLWVFPYECEELHVFLRTHLHLGWGVLYIVADEIEHDEALRKHFGLPPAL